MENKTHTSFRKCEQFVLPENSTPTLGGALPYVCRMHIEEKNDVETGRWDDAGRIDEHERHTGATGEASSPSAPSALYVNTIRFT